MTSIEPGPTLTWFASCIRNFLLAVRGQQQLHNSSFVRVPNDMKKLLGFALLFFLSAIPAFGQSAAGSITAANTTCTTGVCVSMTLSTSAGAATITVGGTFSGTLNFELSGDNGVTWTAAPTASTTSTGVTNFNVAGYSNIRVRGNPFASGTANVTIFAGAGSKIGTSAGGSAVSTAGTLTNGNVVTGAGGTSVQDSGTALSSLAPKASPALTGTPTAPTATLSTSTTQLATTAFVEGNRIAAPQFSTTDTLTNATLTSEQVFATQLTIPANTLAANVVLKFVIGIDVTQSGTGSNAIFRVKLCTVSGCGSGTIVNVYQSTNTTPAAGTFSSSLPIYLQGTAAPGAAVTIMQTTSGALGAVAPIGRNTIASAVANVPTNAAMFLQLSVQYATTTASDSVSVTQLIAEPGYPLF